MGDININKHVFAMAKNVSFLFSLNMGILCRVRECSPNFMPPI